METERFKRKPSEQKKRIDLKIKYFGRVCATCWFQFRCRECEIMTVSKWNEHLWIGVLSHHEDKTQIHTAAIGCVIQEKKRKPCWRWWWRRWRRQKHQQCAVCCPNHSRWVFVKPGRDQKTKDKEIRLRSFGVHVSMCAVHLLMCKCTFIITHTAYLLLTLLPMNGVTSVLALPSSVIWW